MPTNYRATAEQLIRSTAQRVTNARIEVLATLLKADGAMSHGEIEAKLPRNSGIDRVTVYRVLDWLTTQNLAHKISGDDRVWRFNAAATAQSHQHAHFQCKCCARVICLDDYGAAVPPPLPVGYTSEEMDVTIKGLCAECAPGNPAHDPSKHRHGLTRRGGTGLRR
jgi:Fur family ferric uptake transcriptional regulator